MGGNWSSSAGLLWVRWILANFVGCATGLVAVWQLGRWGVRSEGIVAPGAFAVAGVLAGALQAWVLRPLVSPVRWLAASVAGLVVGVAALGIVFGLSVGLLGEESNLGLTIAALACGVPPGVAQWIVLRQALPGSICWIPGSMVGMAGCVITFLTLTRGADVALEGIGAAAAASGAVYGAVTGAILATLVVRRTRLPCQNSGQSMGRRASVGRRPTQS